MTPTPQEQEEFDRLFMVMNAAYETADEAVIPLDIADSRHYITMANADFAEFCLQHRGKTFTLPGGEEGDK